MGAVYYGGESSLLNAQAETFYIKKGIDESNTATETMKPVTFMGASQDDLRAFPAEARHAAGFDLEHVQRGEHPADFKPMPSVGAGAFEIRVRTDDGAFRVLYVAKFAESVYVLHAFEKKSQKTLKQDLETGRRRYAAMQRRRGAG